MLSCCPTARGSQPNPKECGQNRRQDSGSPRGLSTRRRRRSQKSVACAALCQCRRQPFPARRVPPAALGPCRSRTPAALRGVATAASWFVIIVSLWVADKNGGPPPSLSGLARGAERPRGVHGRMLFVFRFQKLGGLPLYGGAAPSGFWLFVALLTPTVAGSGKDASRWRPSPSSPRSWPPALALAATRLEEHGALITDGLSRAADAAGAAGVPPRTRGAPTSARGGGRANRRERRRGQGVEATHRGCSTRSQRGAGPCQFVPRRTRRAAAAAHGRTRSILAGRLCSGRRARQGRQAHRRNRAGTRH